VRIPAGVEEGTTLRVTGAGEGAVRGGQPGDLYVTIHVEPQRGFERDGSDLIMETKISFPVAALGGELEINSLTGPVTLKIPPGTQPNTLFRIREHGLPRLQSRGHGDLLVRVHVETPTNLSAEQKELLREFSKTLSGSKSTFFKKAFGG
jgi:molecular chaperone DnaJ